MLQLTAEERHALEGLCDEWLDGADDLEQSYFHDKIFEDPEPFLDVINTHAQRTNALKGLREKLRAAGR